MSLRCASLYTFSNAHPVAMFARWYLMVLYGAIWGHMVEVGAIWWQLVPYGAIWFSAVRLRCGLQSLVV